MGRKLRLKQAMMLGQVTSFERLKRGMENCIVGFAGVCAGPLPNS